MGSWPGPAQYPNVHTACADLSEKPSRSLCSCSGPRASINHLLWRIVSREWALEDLKDVNVVWGPRGGLYMYGPGRSFIALKQRHVSSTKTGPLI